MNVVKKVPIDRDPKYVTDVGWAKDVLVDSNVSKPNVWKVYTRKKKEVVGNTA